MCTKDRDKAKTKTSSCVEPATRTLGTADSETERRGLWTHSSRVGIYKDSHFGSESSFLFENNTLTFLLSSLNNHPQQ